MRRVPGQIITGGGGVAVAVASGQNAYDSRALNWANPVIWRADRYTKVTIDIWPGTFPTMPVQILGAKNGDRLIVDFRESNGGGLVTNVDLIGVNMGAASLQDRVAADYAGHPMRPWRLWEWWKDTIYYLLKTNGQIYVTRTLWKNVLAES
jgi:hypothetical protein